MIEKESRCRRCYAVIPSCQELCREDELKEKEEKIKFENERKEVKVAI